MSENNGQVTTADEASDFEIRPEVMVSAVGKLADKLFTRMVTHFPVIAQVKAMFIEFVVALLPVLADLLGQFCSPTPEQLVRRLQAARPGTFRHRRYSNTIARWTVQQFGVSTFMANGGEVLVEEFLTLAREPENEKLLKQAMIEPSPVEAPVWSLL